MPYPMKSKLTPVEAIKNTLYNADADGWTINSAKARENLSTKIWNNILCNFPEIRLANEILKKYYDEWDEKPAVTQEEYVIVKEIKDRM